MAYFTPANAPLVKLKRQSHFLLSGVIMLANILCFSFYFKIIAEIKSENLL